MLTNNLAEYLLVGYPDAEVGKQLTEEQVFFAAEYRMGLGEQAKPSILLAGFFAPEALEATLANWTQRIIGAQTSFSVILNNYGGIPAHTIYLRIQDLLPFQQLVKQLAPVDEFIRASGCPPATFNTRPHLAIARGLTEVTYHKAMAGYSPKTFRAAFMLDELVLLKRANPFEIGKPVQRLRFKPWSSTGISDAA